MWQQLPLAQANTSNNQGLQYHSTVPNDFDLYICKTLPDAERLSALQNHFKSGKNYQHIKKDDVLAIH